MIGYRPDEPPFGRGHAEPPARRAPVLLNFGTKGPRMRVLGINAIYHDPAAALVIDGQLVAAAEEERFSRRKHGKRPVPFSAWEMPELSARWCLAEAGLDPEDIDVATYS